MPKEKKTAEIQLNLNWEKPFQGRKNTGQTLQDVSKNNIYIKKIAYKIHYLQTKAD